MTCLRMFLYHHQKALIFLKYPTNSMIQVIFYMFIRINSCHITYMDKLLYHLPVQKHMMNHITICLERLKTLHPD